MVLVLFWVEKSVDGSINTDLFLFKGCRLFQDSQESDPVARRPSDTRTHLRTSLLPPLSSRFWSRLGWVGAGCCRSAFSLCRLLGNHPPGVQSAGSDVGEAMRDGDAALTLRPPTLKGSQQQLSPAHRPDSSVSQVVKMQECPAGHWTHHEWWRWTWSGFFCSSHVNQASGLLAAWFLRLFVSDSLSPGRRP